MDNETSESEQCKDDAETITNLYEAIPSVVQRLASLWNSNDFFGHVGPAPLPSQ